MSWPWESREKVLFCTTGHLRDEVEPLGSSSEIIALGLFENFLLRWQPQQCLAITNGYRLAENPTRAVQMTRDANN
jgi:hypothetical protein